MTTQPDHYGDDGTVDRVLALLPTRPSPRALAALDQFHTRGAVATAELASRAGLQPGWLVLDVGCGLGGPARQVADRFGVCVVGCDLSQPFVAVGQEITRRCGLEDQVRLMVASATALPVNSATMDAVMVQHVTMNIHDRSTLYAELARVLRPGGVLVCHDIVQKRGPPIYPVPWARVPEQSHLLTTAQTLSALAASGFQVDHARDETAVSLAWFAATAGAPPSDGPTLATAMGRDFPTLVANHRRSLESGATAVLSVIARRAVGSVLGGAP
ncbi:MAG: class I SAM-dependent methyltransferase [Alphaproteobacteria bacterium]|nr:class I SAM-dependent methyltransferase [Alphaproteobacteria bacterium]